MLNVLLETDDHMNKSFDFSELANIVNINSYTKNKSGVDRVGNLYEQIFDEIGFKTIRYTREKVGDHLLFTSASTGGDKLLLLGHLDTVHPPGVFTDFHQDQDWIYGPGVCDMKGGNHVAISALRHVKTTLGNIADIDLLLVSDEETGSDDSKVISSALAKQYAACLVFEAAGVHDEVVVGRKGVGTFTINIQGKAAHAGNHYLSGANANLVAAHMIIDLTNLTSIEQGSTVNAGEISGGIGANTISPHSKIVVEIRYTQHKERDRLLAAIEQIVNTSYVEGVTSTLSGGIQRDVMQPNCEQSSLISKLEKIVGEHLATEQRGGVSDANVIAAAGIPTLDGFGPYGDGDHTLDERASRKSFLRRVNQVSKILLAYNGIKCRQRTQ